MSQKPTYEELEQRVQEFEELFDLVHDMVCIASTDGYFKRLNPAWETKLGFSIEELLSKPFLDFIHPDDREKTIAEVKNQVSGKSTIKFKNRYRCRDGSYKVFEWKATPAIGKNLYGVARDITDIKKTEAKLSKTEIRLLNIFEAFDMISVMLDRNGDIIFCSDFLLNLAGWERGEVLGKNWFNIFLPGDVSIMVRHQVFNRMLESGDFPKRFKNEIVTRWGKRIMITWNNTVFFDSKGVIEVVASIGELASID